jgi:hypothetical protein
MTVKNHIHRYIRAVGRITEKNKNSGMLNYYRCADPDCSHYIRDILVLGKKSLCNRCGKEFNMPIALRAMTNRPHCKDCTKGKRTVIKKQVQVFDRDELELE